MKTIKYVLFLCIVLCLKPSLLNSQNKPINNRFIINASYCRSWKDDTTSYVELTASYYTGLTVLQKDSVGYSGSISLQIFLKKQSDSLFYRIGNFIIPVTIKDTSKKEMTEEITSKMTYILGIGSYQLSVVGYDMHMPSHRDSLKYNFTIQRRPNIPVTSDLDLCTNIFESSDKNDKFYKNGYCVYSNPSLVFGSNRFPVIFSYIELYNFHNGSIYSINMQILDSKGRIRKSVKRMRHITFANTVDVATININTLNSAKYYFQYIISDTSGNEIAHTGKNIFIYNPSVQPSSETIMSAKGAELAGLSDQEIVDEFRSAQYIAQPDQIRMFDKLNTIEARREFLAKFWSDIESGQNDQIDLTRTIYLNRVLTANQRYHTLSKQGWQTDRGRVYLLYGEPDDIQRFPSAGNSKPYEKWSYNQIEGGVIFVFIDRSGFGNYTLVHSTKRGEIQDESWQQYLQ